MTVYLHIGVGKTGTSTLQVMLENNRDVLAGKSVHVPRFPQSRNHRALAMYALDDDIIDNSRKAKGLTTLEKIEEYRTVLRDRLTPELDEMRAAGSIVFTSEQLTRLSRPSEFERLRSLLAPISHEIKIIVYLRRQDEYYTSAYSQHIKGGQDIDMKPSPKLRNQSVYDYERFLSGWAEAFGTENIIVRVFEPNQLKNKDVLADFASVIGLDSLEGLTIPPRHNESLDVNTIQYLRLLKDHFPRFINNKVNTRRVQLIQALETISDQQKVRLSHEDATQFLKLFDKSNAAVARTYLGRKNGKLFTGTPREDDAVTPELDLEKALEISARLLKLLLKR